MIDLFNPNVTEMSKLNSMTKYPSILTFHDIDRGILQDQLVTEDGTFPADDPEIFVTEKVDGTNSRILLFGGDYIIGSREELLCAKGDRFFNPAQEIVATVRQLAETLAPSFQNDPVTDDVLFVLYGESYGGSIGKGAKQYSGVHNRGFRVFDAMIFHPQQVESLMYTSREGIAMWRDGGGQKFMSVDHRNAMLRMLPANMDSVPYIRKCKLSDIPTDIEGAYNWLCQFRNTNVALDQTGKGQAEGVVIRTADRSFIRKLRFEDYEKPLRKLGKLKK